jgi:hypothetical protein
MTDRKQQHLAMSARRVLVFVFLGLTLSSADQQTGDKRPRVYIEAEALTNNAEGWARQYRNNFGSAFPLWCDGAVVTDDPKAANYVIRLSISAPASSTAFYHSMAIFEPNGDQVYAHVADKPDFFPMEACAVIVYKISRRVVLLTGSQALQRQPRFSFKAMFEASDLDRRRDFSQTSFRNICFGLTPAQTPGEADYSVEVGMQKAPDPDLVVLTVFERAGTKVFESGTHHEPTDLLTRACSAIVLRESAPHSAKQ